MTNPVEDDECPVLSDSGHRKRIAEELDTTLFVEAGAGSGKTSALVTRVVSLVTRGDVELAHIAAITFTDKAATELRDRIREALRTRAAKEEEAVDAQRCKRALDQLDGAAIGTLHAFAQRILSEHPIEAHLPPRVEVLDEVSSSVSFEQRWSAFQDELFADAAIERSLLLFFAAGIRPTALRDIAGAFEDNWDLVEDNVPAHAPEPPDVRRLVQRARDEARSLLRTPCSDPDDKLRQRIEAITRHLEEIAGNLDEVALIESLGPEGGKKAPSFGVGQLGRKTSWADVEDIRQRVRDLGSDVDAITRSVVCACAEQIGAAIRRFTLSSARERRDAGRLEFHDLLVLARALLRNPVHGADVRAHLHDRYRRLLLDEFQDTDPIQVELAARIAAAAPRAPATANAAWNEVDVEPGRLFIVGDPKQSIYRFRRADLSVFRAASAQLGSEDGHVELTANFRTTEPVIDWVNTTFGSLMASGTGATALTGRPPAGHDAPPPFLPLHATRPSANCGPAVSVLGRSAHPVKTPARELRAAESAGVASVVARALREGWTVDDGRGGWRPARFGDIAVLMPTRSSLPALEDALDGSGIPYRTESATLVYASREIRDVLMILRAVDDPTNELHVISALRTPYLACGDDDLFRFRRERGGRWDYLDDQPRSVPGDDPVGRALAYLRSLYDDRHWRTPSEMLEQVLRDRRAFELGCTTGRPRDVWRRLRFVLDQARAWAEATGGNLRQYVAWVTAQAREDVRASELVLSESDDDAVRIMTIHAAKGLEFPITVVAGMTSSRRSRPSSAAVVFPPGGGVGYGFGKVAATETYASFKARDAQEDEDERIRLLYVACTRARDHLVVSAHRAMPAGAPKTAGLSGAELLVNGMGALFDEIPDAEGDAVLPAVRASTRCPAPPPYATWARERDDALAEAARPRTIAATAIGELDGGRSAPPGSEPDPGMHKEPRDLDLPPWLKGRYGSSVGRTVHGVLQTIDLSTAEGIEAAVMAQCEAEGVTDRSGDVHNLVKAALRSPSVIEAASCAHWREVYVCVPVGDSLIEGYLDLLYRAPDGLVVVDYKTSSTADAGAIDSRFTAYRNQGAAYALAVERATGQRVARVAFVFLTPAGASERHLVDLDVAIGHVGDLVAASTAAPAAGGAS